MVEANYEGEVNVVVIEDEKGNESYFEEELIIEHDGKEFAILVSLPGEDCEEDCECHKEAEIIVARIDADESGENIYVAPTDEEFEAVLALYEEMDAEL